MRITLRYILSTLLLLFISSCVGTIEDKNPDTTKPAEIASKSIPFNGLTRAIAISNSRVELYFLPAPGVPDSLTYLIYINNNPSPIEVKGSALEINPLGEYRYTVTNLFTNTLYQFRVGVRDAANGSQSDNDKSLSARTFSNITATFNGISAAYPAAGVDGQSSIVVEWVPAVTLSSSVFSPRITDPIGYEVKYMPASAGNILALSEPNNPNVTTQTLPSVINSTTNGSSERIRTITGLQPNTTYNFQVRAIHKSWGEFRDDPNYKYEKNSKVIAATTRAPDEDFSFNRNSLSISAPPGPNGLSRAVINWDGAQGPYVHYRLYFQQAASPGATDFELDNLVDPFDQEAIDILNDDPTNYTIISPGETTYTRTNLLSYHYYHAKLVVCLTFDCEATDRELTSLVLYRVVPRIAAFDGINNIQNPIDVDNPDRVKLTFNPAVTTVGVLTGLEVYCHTTIDDTEPILVPIGSAIPNGVKDGCDGLSRLTPDPNNLAGYTTFDEITIGGIQYLGSTALENYCLSIVPVIEGANYARRELDSAVVRCARPEIQLPSVEEFPGAINICSTTSDTLNARWTAPQGGLYSNFQVYWKEVDGTPFKFTEAISESDSRYVNNELDIAGNTQVLDLNSTEYLITNLTPGRRYQFGVLAYVETSPGERAYSEFNQAPRECTLPLPRASFDEWVHISAVGPKESGLHEVTHPDRFILETFDDFGMPIEIETDSTHAPTDEFQSQFGPRRGNISFDGVYGTPNGDPTSPDRHQYSNTGIVQLLWKDVIIDGQTPLPLGAYIDTLEENAFKPSRQTGYRIYRSSDGMNTWVDLTSTQHPFQTATNAGLIHPMTLFERMRSNEESESFSGVVFTDYSVQSFDHRFLDRDDHDRIDRARVYHYKVVPVLRGIELNFNNENQNIIRVTLPPRNQALVHRLIANRQTCREMGRTYSRDISNHYTCQYNGVGARALSSPWRSDSVVYDQGGDVLVDRFELGCDFSRGDISNSRSHFNSGVATEDAYEFKGYNNDEVPFKGCLYSVSGVDVGDSVSSFTPTSPPTRSGADTPDSISSYESYKQILRGDCFGGDRVTVYQNSSSVCANPAIANRFTYVFPGARAGSEDYYTCTNPSNLLDTFLHLFNADTRSGDLSRVVAQSEFAGVHHNTSMISGDWTGRTLPHYRSGNSLPVNDSKILIPNLGRGPSSCFVNLPVMDPGDEDRLVPRWIPIDKLHDLTYVDLDGEPESSIDILTMPLSDILNDGRLYNDGVTTGISRASAPPENYINARYDDQPNRVTEHTPLARVVSSNASKLPPINGLRQEQANRICSTYQVEVGQLDASGNYLTLSSPKPRHLMRRKEFVAAAAWHPDFSNTQIVDIEQGIMERLPYDDDASGTIATNNSCNSTNRDVVSYSETSNAGSIIDPRQFDSRNRPSYFTGSSFYDHQHFNSSLCQSRYGIQDMVGNIAEWGTEVFRCDTSQEEFFLGVRNNPAASIPISSNEVVDSTLQPWVLGNLDSGRCSPVSIGDDRPRQMNDTFIPRSFELGGAFAPVFDGIGNLNSNLVLTPQLDQESVNQLRNGDGFFLDFGSTGIGPPIDAHDTLALRNSSRGDYRDGDARRGLAFNPVLGIPLECNFGTCTDTPDNLAFISTDLRNRIDGDPANYEVPNFPIGNSNIRSDGLAEWTIEETFRTERDRARSYTYIESINPGETPPADRVYRTRNEIDTDEPHEAIRVRYEVPRNARMSFVNGGRREYLRSGRYTTFYTYSAGNRRNLDETGVRCSVMINMD